MIKKSTFPIELFDHWNAPFCVDEYNMFVRHSNSILQVACCLPDETMPIPRGYGAMSYLPNGNNIFTQWEAWFKEQGFQNLNQIADLLNELWSSHAGPYPGSEHLEAFYHE